MKQNIRAKILLLTALTIIPIVGLLIYFNIQQLKQAQESQMNNLENIAKIIATENSRVKEGARQLLISLSISPQIRTDQCTNFLSDLLSNYQRYANFGVADLEGNVICSAVSTEEKINISKRFSFRQTILTNEFTTGEYLISPITKNATFNFAYPLSNPAGVVYASLDLSWLNNLVGNLVIDKQLSVLITDKNYTIVANYPEAKHEVGSTFSIHSDPNMLYQLAKIDEGEDSLMVAVGIPRSSIFDEPNDQFIKNLGLTLIIAIVSLLVGWFIGNSLIQGVIKSLNQVDQLKRDFVSLVTHQIRTPITAIKWFTQILLSGSAGKLTKKQTELLNDTHTSVVRMTNLVSTLLTISKLESGKIPVNYSKVSTKKLITECYEEINEIFSKKQIKFKINISQAYISADHELLKQVLANLIVNACKFSKSHCKIMVKVKKANKEVVFEIADQGIGIPKKDQELIWKKFVRGTNAHKSDTEGAGLGLYLAKLIIEAHQGRIWFTSSCKGTSFFFTIPDRSI